MFETIAYAAAAADPNAVPPSMNLITTIIPFAIVFVFMYFMMIRPQKKREKEMKAMLAALKVGDKVVTIGGICGKVIKLKDEYVVLETGSTGNPNEKSYVKMERSAIRDVEKKIEA